ncbi:MAG: hypothetical protein IKN72_02310 [Clostridia bacterium]|nr:hypothetical protein [Clostridia bacterium]
MIIKNGTKPLLILSAIGGAIFGIVMALYFGLMYRDKSSIILGLSAGGLWFILYFLAMFLLVRKNEQNAESLHRQIELARKVICEGPVLYINGSRRGTGGWMFLSEDAVEFYRVKGNFGGNNVAIPLDDVVSVTVGKRNPFGQTNQMTIQTCENHFVFSVAKAKVWKAQIDQAVAS